MRGRIRGARGFDISFLRDRTLGGEGTGRRLEEWIEW
jgi:hypothetical protein